MLGVIVILLLLKYRDDLKKLCRDLGEWLGRWRIKHEVTTNCNKGLKQINSQVGEDSFYPLKIKYGKGGAIQTDKQITILIDYSEDIAHIYIEAVKKYIDYHFIPTLRNFLENKDLLKSTDLVVAEKILSASEREAPLKEFKLRVVIPEIKRNLKLKEYYDLIKKIDDRGLLTRIFLPLLIETDNKLHENPTKRDEVSKGVAESFAIIAKIATKGIGERVPTQTFNSEFISFSIMLISQKILLYKQEKYLNYKKYLEKTLQDVHNVYILAAGVAIKPTKEMVEMYFKKLKIKEGLHTLPSGKIGICILLRKQF